MKWHIEREAIELADAKENSRYSGLHLQNSNSPDFRLTPKLKKSFSVDGKISFIC
jgi:hypothetical protein